MNTCSETNIHLYDSSEHLMKLSMQFDAFNCYFAVNIKRYEFVFTCIVGVSTFTRQCNNINYVRWVKFITSHVSFISKQQ